MKKYFITSTGTEIGKTFYLCKYIREILSGGYSVKALKPVITGLDFNDLEPSDSGQILNALGEEINRENILKISPFYYDTPASPDSAAILENKPFLDYKNILTHCQNFLEKEDKDYAIIEGIGGIMVPLNEEKTVLDLIKDLDIETILIVGNYLGSRSHSLTALETCKNHAITVQKLVINDFNSDGEDAEMVAKSLRNFFKGKLEILQ